MVPVFALEFQALLNRNVALLHILLEMQSGANWIDCPKEWFRNNGIRHLIEFVRDIRLEHNFNWELQIYDCLAL